MLKNIDTLGPKTIILLGSTFVFCFVKYVIGLITINIGWLQTTNIGARLIGWDLLVLVLVQLIAMWISFMACGTLFTTKTSFAKQLIIWFSSNYLLSLVVLSLVGIFTGLIIAKDGTVLLMSVVDVLPNCVFILLLAKMVNFLRKRD